MRKPDFDLFLARISIACDFLVYAGLVFNQNSTQFLVLTGLQALGKSHFVFALLVTDDLSLGGGACVQLSSYKAT